MSVKPEISPKSSFVDIEAQRIPDYASMEIYHDVTGTAGGKVFSSEDESDESSELRKAKKVQPSTSRRPKGAFSGAYNRLGDFLKSHVLYKSSSDDSEEEESPLLQERFLFKSTFSSPRSDDSVHSIYSDSYTRSDMSRLSRRSNIVPPLHLSPLDSSSSVSATQRSLFKNVQYEVVREISSSTSTSSEYGGNLRQRTRGNRSRRMYDSSSTNVSYMQDARVQRRSTYNTRRMEVRQYYKGTKPAESASRGSVRKRKKMPSGLLRFLTKLFHKVSTFYL